MNNNSGKKALGGVTVLIATNRINQWLSDAVESVINSDETTEVLLVLDGVKLAGQSWAKNSRVATINRETSTGLADALNLGLSNIQTPYVARLDADDLALPGRFVWQAEYLRDNPEVSLVCGVADVIDENGVQIGVRLPKGFSEAKDLRPKLLERNPVIHPAVMYRTQEVLGLGGYARGLRAMEDYELWLRLALVGPIIFVNREAIKYRVHSGQMTHGASPFGRHIDLISEKRLALAAILKVNLVYTAMFIVLWRSSQVIRFLKTKLSEVFRGD